MDRRGAGGDWLIGALVGYELAGLEIGEAAYKSEYAHFGLYGRARLSEHLLLDGAATYGLATPEVALGDVSASYDAKRITARGALTGDFGFEYGSVRVGPQVGLLYSRETLGSFADSAGGIAEREIPQEAAGGDRRGRRLAPVARDAPRATARLAPEGRWTQTLNHLLFMRIRMQHRLEFARISQIWP